jgi:hypothetical protein
MPETLTETQLGSFYPRDHVIAVMPDRVAVMDGTRELKAAGFKDIEVWSPTEVIHEQAVAESERNVFQKLGALVSDEENWAREYAEFAAQGQVLVAVLASEPEEAQRAGDILGAFGGHSMRHYGARTVTDLLAS